MSDVYRVTQEDGRRPQCPQACGCKSAVYCADAEVAFDPDVYDCARCGHMNGSHCGPNGECMEPAETGCT